MQEQIQLTETAVLTELTQLKQSLVALSELAVWATHEQLSQQYAQQLQQMALRHKERKQGRDHQRIEYSQTLSNADLANALLRLQQQSQQDGIERRRLKRCRDQALQPLIIEMAEATQQIKTLKLRYKVLSRNWQKQIQENHAVQQAKARASTLSLLDLKIHYQDEHIIVVEKPAGLLSVPGRRYHLQDSVLSRLHAQLKSCSYLQLPHRLDQATSGILVVARSHPAQAAMSQKFAQQQVTKTYEALLCGEITARDGVIELPLWADPNNCPRQQVNFEQGKPSKTKFRLMTPGHHPRVEFVPVTGRTHQLRVHAAHPDGLNAPILGDGLYGADVAPRLHLHATCLAFEHPITRKELCFHSRSSF